jgi:hypothetical protein
MKKEEDGWGSHRVFMLFTRGLNVIWPNKLVIGIIGDTWEKKGKKGKETYPLAIRKSETRQHFPLI